MRRRGRSASLNFYPRPPRGGRPPPAALAAPGAGISIHALREEGDLPGLKLGGLELKFLSTPSARRATAAAAPRSATAADFYPRPPRGGRLALLFLMALWFKISIHALREEGDL